MKAPKIAESIQDGLTPTPLSPEEHHQLIGALYLEIHLLRRHVAQLRAALDRREPRRRMKGVRHETDGAAVRPPATV
jgi:hypothetical protein